MAPVKEIRAFKRMQKTVNEEHVIECRSSGALHGRVTVKELFHMDVAFLEETKNKKL